MNSSIYITGNNTELDQAMVRAYLAWKNRHKQVKPLKPKTENPLSP